MRAARKLVSDYRTIWEAVIRSDAPLRVLDPLFHVPCFVVSLGGTMTLNVSATEITDVNRMRLDAFRQGRVRSASLRAIDALSQGPHLSLAMVNWELTRAHGSLDRAWRHHYTTHHGEAGSAATIVVSAFQTGA